MEPSCKEAESASYANMRDALLHPEKRVRAVDEESHLHREDNRDMDSSQMARKSPMVTAGWIRRVSAPVPSEVAIDPRRVHSSVWIQQDANLWIP